MFSKIREWFFRKSLKEKAATSSNPTHKLKKVGLIIDGKTLSHTEVIYQFSQIFKNINNIHTLSFVNEKSKEAAENTFNKRHINWYGKPNSQEVSQFISEKYDLLFLMSYSQDPFYIYIVNHTEANLVMGINVKKEHINLFDACIEVDQKKGIIYAMKELKSLLEIITNGEL